MLSFTDFRLYVERRITIVTNIEVWYTQEVPIFMSSVNDMEICPASFYFCLILARFGHFEYVYASCP